MTRDEAIAQGVDAAQKLGEAIRALEAVAPTDRLARLHQRAGIVGRDFEDYLGLAGGTIVPLDGDPIKGP